MLAAALTLAPLLARWIPDIVGWLGGDDAEEVASQVVNVAQAVVGSTDPVVVAAAIEDPKRASDLALALGRIAAEREAKVIEAQTTEIVARLRDVADARATTVALAAAGSRLAYLAPVVCGVIFSLFVFVVVAETFGYGEGISDKTRALLDYLAIAGASYAIGSSAGSANKDARQTALLAASAPTHRAEPETPPAVAAGQARRLFGRG